jgi:hypothetical protein
MKSIKILCLIFGIALNINSLAQKIEIGGGLGAMIIRETFHPIFILPLLN